MTKNYGRDDLMAVAAFRYCCGRKTYIVSDCADWLIEQWPNIAERARNIIQRDLMRHSSETMSIGQRARITSRSATTATGRNGKKYGGCGNADLYRHRLPISPTEKPCAINSSINSAPRLATQNRRCVPKSVTGFGTRGASIAKPLTGTS